MWSHKKSQGGHAMKWSPAQILGGAVAVAALAGALAAPAANASNDRPLFMAVGSHERAPIGWPEFCLEYVYECETEGTMAHDGVVHTEGWNDHVRIDIRLNDIGKP